MRLARARSIACRGWRSRAATRVRMKRVRRRETDGMTSAAGSCGLLRLWPWVELLWSRRSQFPGARARGWRVAAARGRARSVLGGGARGDGRPARSRAAGGGGGRQSPCWGSGAGAAAGRRDRAGRARPVARALRSRRPPADGGSRRSSRRSMLARWACVVQCLAAGPAATRPASRRWPAARFREFAVASVTALGVTLGPWTRSGSPWRSRARSSRWRSASSPIAARGGLDDGACTTRRARSSKRARSCCCRGSGRHSVEDVRRVDADERVGVREARIGPETRRFEKSWRNSARA